jgi:CubicO group peptidase (beta-lactamase class C family)
MVGSLERIKILVDQIDYDFSNFTLKDFAAWVAGRRGKSMAHIKVLVDQIDYDFSNFTIEDFAAGVARQRGNPIILQPWEAMPKGVFGLWLSCREKEFIYYNNKMPLTLICVHHLIEQGKLEWDAPIAAYWPEFGCRGKEKATIRHTLLQQAGIPSRGMYAQVPLWPNWRLVTKNVAGTKAEFEPGSKTAYHFVNYGFILGEVVRRISGKPIDQYLAEFFFKPLGLKDSYLGLPSGEHYRAVKLHAGHRDQLGTVFVFNLPIIRTAVIPAATLHSSARDMAVFFQMLLNQGEYAGQRLLHRETIAAATASGYEGYDATVGKRVRWAYGFHLGGPELIYGRGMGKKSTVRTFGFFGQRSSMVWADPDTNIVVVLTHNRLLSTDESRVRWQLLSDAVWDAVR